MSDFDLRLPHALIDVSGCWHLCIFSKLNLWLLRISLYLVMPKSSQTADYISNIREIWQQLSSEVVVKNLPSTVPEVQYQVTKETNMRVLHINCRDNKVTWLGMRLMTMDYHMTMDCHMTMDYHMTMGFHMTMDYHMISVLHIAAHK